MRIERQGERHEGLALGIDRRHLLRLRRGEPEPDYEIDLHGLDARAARRDLALALREVQDAGGRCVLVIHGRGHGSEGCAVLKEALPGWLGDEPLARRVMAFASARREDGGAGATYVLLRRHRPKR